MSKSLWQKIEVKGSATLSDSILCDICIVGAGIAGLTAAYRLVMQGVKVTVIHADDLKAGETSKSTAQINTAHDDGWVEMLDIHGEDNLKLCYQSYLKAAGFIEETVTKHRLECGYEKISAYLYTHDREKGQEWVDKEFDAAKKAGVRGLSKVKTTPLPEYHKGPALLYEDQAQFQPLAYLNSLRKILLQSGLCRIYGNCGVSDVSEGNHLVELSLENGKTVSAKKVILATNVPIHRKLIPIEALAAYRSYVVGFRVEKGAIPLHQYWDNLDPYHYVRLESAAASIDHPPGDSDILLVGGEDHRVGEEKDIETHYKSLIEWGEANFPVLEATGLRWSAQTIETFDGMPLIGSCSAHDNIFIITGDSGTGITHGTLGGLMVAEKLLGINSAWEDLYKPSRNRVKSIKRWGKENLTGIASYQDWFTAGEVDSEDKIEKETGAILREGISKVAVYRDKNGELTRFSATCPHLGAIVRWNPVEKSWDCPAHGSRFSAKGEVLNGPACCGLECMKS